VQGFMPNYNFKDPMAAIRQAYIQAGAGSQDESLNQGNDTNSTDEEDSK